MAWVYARKYSERFKKVTLLEAITIFSILFLGVVFNQHIPAIILLIALYLADIIFDFFLKFTLRPVYHVFPAGIELVTFNTVVAGYALGPWIGAFCGLLFGITYYGIIFNFNSRYQMINIPSYAVMGFLAGALGGSFATVGMTLAIMYGVFTTAAIFMLFGSRLDKSFIFLSTYILFNYWLFTNVSAIILNIISL